MSIFNSEELSGQCGIDFKCCRETYQPCKYYDEKSVTLGNTKFTSCLFLKISCDKRNRIEHCTNDFAKRDVLLNHLKQYIKEDSDNTVVSVCGMLEDK